jgi:2-polyprenyl-3-methyl-5-hydroxy-6-metoxy-1,4-benzoquinol methylase
MKMWRAVKKIEIFSETKKEENFPTNWYEIADIEHFWCIWRNEVFKRMLKVKALDTNKKMLVLDAGCGNGIVRHQIESDSNWIVDGVDIEFNILESNHNKMSRGRTLFYDINERNELFKERYDIIILFDVLEHLSDPKKFLDAAGFHLKENGFIFLNVPACESLRSRYDNIVGHIIRYDRKSLMDLVKEVNFKCIEAKYWGFFLYPIGLFRKIYLGFSKNDDKLIKRGFEPPVKLINIILLFLMKIEFMFSFSNEKLGSSIILAAKKITGKEI